MKFGNNCFQKLSSELNLVAVLKGILHIIMCCTSCKNVYTYICSFYQNACFLYTKVAIGDPLKARKYPIMSGKDQWIKAMKENFPNDHAAIDKHLELLQVPVSFLKRFIDVGSIHSSCLGQRFLIFRFTDPLIPNSLVLEKKIKLKFRKMFFVGLNYSLHLTKTHENLKHDYITGFCTHGHDYLILGSTRENSQSLKATLILVGTI